MLVTTNRSFLTFLEHELDGALAAGLELVHVALPPDLAAAVARANEIASEEMN